MSVDGTSSSPDKAKIPTGKQLPRTPPSLNATTDNSSLGDSLGNDSCSPTSRRMSSFYSPSMTKVQSKIRRDKSRAQLQVSCSEFDLSVRSGEKVPAGVMDKDPSVGKMDHKDPSVGMVDQKDPSGPLNTSSISLAPPPGRQLAHSPPGPAVTAVSAPCSSPPTHHPVVPAIAATHSPPVPAVAKLAAAPVLQHDLHLPDGSTMTSDDRSTTPDLSLPPTPHVVSRSDSPDLPLPPPPHLLEISAPPTPSTPTMSTLVSKHLIPTGRQLPSTPQLHTAKLTGTVEPSGKYELPAELETVAIPTQEEVDMRERKRVEEEDRKQKVAAKEVERQMEKVRKAEEFEKKRLEEAECERKRIELVKRQELEERQKFEAEKKMIAEMKQQLMEKAQLLEEKERQLKIEEARRIQEEVKRKKDEQSRKEEIKKIEENRKKEELKRCEEDRLKQEELKKYEESRKEELYKSVEKSAEKSFESSVSKGKRIDRKKDDLKTEIELENKTKDSDQKKLAILAKEKKLRDEAEFKKRGEIKKTKIMKQDLKSSEEMTMLSEKSPVEPELDNKVVKDQPSCLSDIPRQEMLSQPSKAKSPGRKPTKYLKLTEAEMRDKQKKEMMEAKIAKRKLLVEQRIQNAEATRGKARAQMEKYENDKMDKMLRKSIKSAEANLTSSASEETLENVSGLNNSEYMSRSNGSNPDLGNKFDDSISRPEDLVVIPPKVAEPIPDPESPPQMKKKTIRIGRRPPKKATSIDDAPKVEEVEPPTVNEVQVESVVESVDEIDNLPIENKSEESDEKSTNPEGRSSNVETVDEIIPLTNSHVDDKKEECAPVDDTCSESVLYPAVSTRRRSQCPPPVPETVQSKSRTTKRKPVAVVLQEESPPKKVKNTAMKAVTGDDKPKRGRKKHVDVVPEIVTIAEEEGSQEVEEPHDMVMETVKSAKDKGKSSRNRKQVTSINPPIVHDESSLLGKLEKRRKRIDETIKNPETAISASKISKKVATPVKITSLEKKLHKQRKVVEEAAEEESQNPTPVKSLIRQSRRNPGATKNIVDGAKKQVLDAKKKRESIVEEESPPKKAKGAAGKISLKNKIGLPEIHQDSSLFEKLDQRRKKMEEPFCAEELTFANKFNKKAPAVELTESLEKKLTKQRNKADEVPEKSIDNEESAKVTKRAGKVSKANKAKEPKFEKKVGKLSTRKSSEEQDYYTAAEDSILLTRPRRNCKKKFDNLEGLASSSVSNTPTPIPEEADKSRPSKFQFPSSSKVPEIVNDDKPVKKRPGRKPAKSLRTAPELSVGDVTPPNPTSVEVIVHPPDESKSETPKLAKTRKPKQHQEVSESAKKSKKSNDECIMAEKSKPVPRNTNSRRTKAEIRGALISMDDEVYKTPSTKIQDEVYQTPRPMGSFSEVLDEEYKTPEETIRKPRRNQARKK
eukprot:TRINITY_DN9656_c0_g1_i1.p1 TRINITY_DN9656_c0_g1~~TRINITY_DN9656_c0_g1_i1.p1  ORF type:complete len:1462 (+),score=569.03 TRINITY_DN9656_c0_g1_i1:128-4387(+)